MLLTSIFGCSDHPIHPKSAAPHEGSHNWHTTASVWFIASSRSRNLRVGGNRDIARGFPSRERRNGETARPRLSRRSVECSKLVVNWQSCGCSKFRRRILRNSSFGIASWFLALSVWCCFPLFNPKMDFSGFSRSHYTPRERSLAYYNVLTNYGS